MLYLPRRTYVVLYFAYRNVEGLHLDPFGNKFMVCTSAKKEEENIPHWIYGNSLWLAGK